MIGFDLDSASIVKATEELESVMSSNPKAKTKLRKLIRDVLTEVRAKMVNAVPFKHGDPRQSRRAIKRIVYKKVLGGAVDIYNSRKAHGATPYQPTRHPSRIGGNRRNRSALTDRIMSYNALDRGFILRFINTGTDKRHITFTPDPRRANIKKGSRGGNTEKYGKTYNTGNRARVRGAHWFLRIAEPRLREGADKLERLIDTEITKMLKS